MLERAKKKAERAKEKVQEKVVEKVVEKVTSQVNELQGGNPTTQPQLPADFNPFGGHAGVIALSDLSLTLASLLPPTLIAALSFNVLRRHEVAAVPTLLISGGLAWMGYKMAEPIIFEGRELDKALRSN